METTARELIKVCIDKFLVTEDLLINEVTFFHIRDYYYAEEFGMTDNAFDHGAVRMVYNHTKTPTGPGQFKIDPFLIRTGALDSIIKQTIFEANLFTTEDANLMKIYEDRNKIVVPLLQRLADIEKDRTCADDPGLYEDEEHQILQMIEEQDRKLPKLNELIEMNAQKADYVLTEIQSGVVTKVKATQIQMKKEAKNKLKNLILDLGRLNNELEQTNDQGTRDRMLEAKEAFQSEYNNQKVVPKPGQQTEDTGLTNEQIKKGRKEIQWSKGGPT